MANEYESILEEAIDIAERASEIALSHFRKAILIEMKENLTPVTIADKKTEEAIRFDIERSYPDHGIIGEEFGEVSQKSDYVWTIDPIDGTRSFIRGIPLFGTLISLLKNGEPIIGVMVLPALRETYWALKGEGTFCNGHQLHVSATTSLEASFASCGDPGCFEDAGKSTVLQNLIKHCDVVRGYTDCFGHSLLFRGGVDAMVDPVVSIWDVAPLALMAEEAGGAYFSFSGERTIRDTSFITCTPKLRDAILGLQT